VCAGTVSSCKKRVSFFYIKIKVEIFIKVPAGIKRTYFQEQN
jgi:hypothetical protein